MVNLVRRSRFAPIAGAAAFAMLASTALDAQTRSLSWTETTRMEVPGSLGLILRMAGAGDPITTRSAMHLQGNALIQETDETTVVTDLDAGRWITVDHQARTYTTMTFADLQRMSEQAMVEMQTAAAQANADVQASREELRRSQEEAQAEINFRISAESTGQRQRIGGVDASQHFIIAEFEATSVPEGVEEEPEGGSMYFLTELWQTSDVPGEEELLQEWARALASNAELREAVYGMMESAQETGDIMATSLAAWNPQISAGMAELAEQMEDFEGTTVRSVLTIAMVPLGTTPDRAELLAWQPSAGINVGGAVAGAARGAVADAARGALGGLGRGLLGGRNADPEPEPAAQPRVQAMMRMTTDRSDVAYRESSEDVLGALNARIADYREITLADLMAR